MKKILIVSALTLGFFGATGLINTIQPNGKQVAGSYPELPTQHSVLQLAGTYPELPTQHSVLQLAGTYPELPTQHSVLQLAGTYPELPTQHSITPDLLA